jgi:hypothetical protein
VLKTDMVVQAFDLMTEWKDCDHFLVMSVMES